MLREVTSHELSEWIAYFSVKETVQKDREIATKAKDRARTENY